MRNIAIINTVYDKSTGKIASGLFQYLSGKGFNTHFCYGYGKQVNKKNYYRIDTSVEHYWHALSCRLTGQQGGSSLFATKRLIEYLIKNSIDTVYLISLHGYYLNESSFYQYLINKRIAVIYIMIDEYPFRGKCGYSDDCLNYTKGCGNCPKLCEYPKSLFVDRTKKMFNIKRNAYQRFSRKLFVGPEYTIKAALNSPLMEGIDTEIIDEAIDTSLYCPRDSSELMKELGIQEDRIIVLCIAPLSYERKGVKYFIELARLFEDQDQYVFVHVGYDSHDKTNLPRNYLAIGYVSDQRLLATYYSMADLFVFPSLLDTMPNACLEALACGTPLLCFNISGMPYIADEKTATFVAPKDVEAMASVIRKTNKKTAYKVQTCRNYALSRYDNKLYYEKLLDAGIKLGET